MQKKQDIVLVIIEKKTKQIIYFHIKLYYVWVNKKYEKTVFYWKLLSCEVEMSSYWVLLKNFNIIK